MPTRPNISSCGGRRSSASRMRSAARRATIAFDRLSSCERHSRMPSRPSSAPLRPELIGAVGVRRLTRTKLRHRAELWGMYVRAEHRRAGMGRRLVEEAIQFARDGDGIRQLHLAVTDRAVAAAALYETTRVRRLGNRARRVASRRRRSCRKAHGAEVLRFHLTYKM